MPTASGASYPFGCSTVGGASKGAVRHQGAPEGEAAAEGGPQLEEGRQPAYRAGSGGRPEPLSRIRRRHRKPSQRKIVCTVRLSEEELFEISAGAQVSNMTTAGFLAHCALAASSDLNRTAAEVAGEREIVVEIFAARRQLGYIGNNLNQVAKALNSGADGVGAHSVLEAVHRTAKRLDDAVTRLIDHRNARSDRSAS
ncbi:MobC family plasmid mobilization relaxosome protein [Streptomyces sp. NBC_00320]|uniref:plasmid mobilization protein n=1 Tax=Streptomyces sp. NBC_00320 TaxID=2975711 RepID=UPI00225A82AD|nr:plasmid mobilization relaxosome protein MobC [Streptomyces sp. NBC_00320]MCX5145668.1 MobC family plasmid mobilization relaxosome protein [Streptomyces sp. NBC_00320]